MLKVVVIACALLGILTAVSVESWLRRHVGNRELASDVYSATLEKYSEFWFSLLIPTIVLLSITGVLIGVGIGRIVLIAYAAGAVTCLLSLFIGSRSFVSGTVSAASIAVEGDIKRALGACFRAGSVMGLSVSTLGIIALSLISFFGSQEHLTSIASGFGLGAALGSLGIRLSGAILTSAHKLATTDEHTIDYTGAFAGNGADFAETLILSSCAASLLADVGVATAGVYATFSVDAASKFPIVIMAVGLGASVVGIFAYRASTSKYSHFGFTAGSLLAGALVFTAALYFSDYSLNDRTYAFCIGFGILAQLLCGEFCKAFSMEGSIFRRNLPRTKDEIIDIPMLNGLAVGLISSAVPGILTAVAIFLSFSVAQYYGVALAAVGSTSITAVNLAVREYACTLSSTRSFAETADEKYEDNAAYYNVLRRSSGWSKVAGKAYSAVSATITLAALLMSLLIISDRETIDFSDSAVFGGMVFGTITALLLLGLLIRAILNTTTLMTDSGADDPAEYRNIHSVRGVFILEIIVIVVPVVLGLVMGIDCVIGYVGSAIITVTGLMFAFNNTGRYYDRIASDALSTLIKTIVAVALVCIPAFLEFGGFNN